MEINVRPALTQSPNYGDKAEHVSITMWGNETEELMQIMTDHFPRWAELFASKNSEYGSGSAFELGVRGQFSDIYRKIIKLKRALWDEDESVLTTEGVDEILMDLIGHCFLTLEMRRRDGSAKRASLLADVNERYEVAKKHARFTESPDIEPEAKMESIGEEISPALRTLVEERSVDAGSYQPKEPSNKDWFELRPGVWCRIGLAVRWNSAIDHGELGHLFGSAIVMKYDVTRINSVLVQGDEGFQGWVHPRWIRPVEGTNLLKTADDHK